MKITANSKEFEIKPNTPIVDFISSLGFNPKRCVVELNKKALNYAAFSNILLKNGDVLEIMQIVAGG